MSGTRSWIVAGGGTGGHVTPALALAEAIRARGDEVRILGSRNGLETRLVPEAGFELVGLPARQIAGRGALARAAAVPDLLRGGVAAWRSLGEFGAEIVVSVGGYASVPAVVAAVIRRLPIALIEPNAIPGRANRATARIADRIFVQFDAAATAFSESGRGDRVRSSGIPLRKQLLDAFAAGEPRRATASPLRVMVFGGSQGAQQINDALIEVAPRLADGSFELFHQTGETDRARVAQAYDRAGLVAEVVAFEPDMPRRYAWADVAVCRAGALSMAELAMASLPALLVPYTFAADDHQTANARAQAAAGAAGVLEGSENLAERIATALGEFQRSPHSLHVMSQCAAKLARPRAADCIVAECVSLLAVRNRR